MGAEGRESFGREGGEVISPEGEEHQVVDAGYDSGSDSDEPVFDGNDKKEKSRRPPDNAFAQQRLKAYNPVFTAKSVIPLLILIAVIFAPLGAAMWYASHRIQDITIEYTHCTDQASLSYWLEIPDKYVTYHFRNKHSDSTKAQWKMSTDNLLPLGDERLICYVQFPVKQDMKGPIYFFYRLHKFYANHRRYVKSFSEDQLEGKASSIDTIKNTAGQNCQPLSHNSEGKAYYPCGLIANSYFNDTFSSTLEGVNGTSDDYEMTEKGTAWHSDKDRFKKTKYHHSQIVPPPNWVKMYPDGYNETNVPNIAEWYRFQNWMHPSALPTFNKLALRNDDDTLKEGIYQVTIVDYFPVKPYNGKKYIYISQRSVLGGKNNFLGISWMVGGGVCFLLALALLAINTVRPRKTGDVNLLSWNREQLSKDEKQANDEAVEK